jgi:hypothetical protein
MSMTSASGLSWYPTNRPQPTPATVDLPTGPVRHRHPLPIHTTTSSTVTTAPPHFTVFLMRGYGFTIQSVPHSGQTTSDARPVRS